MDVELQARHFELTDTVRDYVERKVGRLDRYLPDIKATRVDLDHGVTRSRGGSIHGTGHSLGGMRRSCAPKRRTMICLQPST